MADDLNCWLRRVRPSTLADTDGWAATNEGLQSLADIHRRARMVHVVRRRWTLLPTAATVAAATAVVFAVAVSGSRVPTAHPPAPTQAGIRPAAMLLKSYSSCDGLLDGLRSHASANLSAFSYGGMQGFQPSFGVARNASAGAPLSATGAAASSSAQTSTTNVQEAGVDEPDTVKTDGHRVVTVSGGHLRVIDATARRIVGELNLRPYSNADTAQLLISGDHALVLLGARAGMFIGPARPITSAPLPVDTSSDSTLLYVDLSGRPRVVGTLQVSGNILDARMVGSTVRVVASNAPVVVRPRTWRSDKQYRSQLRKTIGATTLRSWLPSYTINGVRTASVPCGAVQHPKSYSAALMLTVYTVDPSKPGADPRPVSVSADGDTVYATSTSLYITSSPDCLSCWGTNPTTKTEIHRFDITGGRRPTYLGSGSVTGSLLSSYSLSDYRGSLRVATTVTGKHGAAVSGVDVLDAKTLRQIGSVSGLGKGERVYAVRFLGRLGYVVTYRQQDPLYVLDLSEATNPRLVGSLKIPGFSSYLHDAGDGQLIGVGQDTRLVKEGGGSYAHNEGRMVQLFDVGDASKPTRTAKVVLPGTGTVGDPSFEPHAFLFWPQTGLVVVPIANSGNGGALAVRLEGSRLVRVGTVSNGSTSDSAIERSMIVDGNLWTFSGSGIRVGNQANLSRLAWIPFT